MIDCRNGQCKAFERMLDVPKHQAVWDKVHGLAEDVYKDPHLCECTDRIKPDMKGYHQFINYNIEDRPLERIPAQYDKPFNNLYRDMSKAYKRCVDAGRCEPVD